MYNEHTKILKTTFTELITNFKKSHFFHKGNASFEGTIPAVRWRYICDSEALNVFSQEFPVLLV